MAATLKWGTDTDLALVPERPGVYLFKDAGGRVLYVGKAADLRARLRGYRGGGDGRLQIPFLLAEAQAVETLVTRTEAEALLLEDGLVKQHQPPHNLRLKDDKSFLMVRLDPSARFPRLELVRSHRPDHGGRPGARLFGPYASAGDVRTLLADLHRVVPLRDCPDSVLDHRTRPCIRHPLGLCAAPCVGLVEEAAYAKHVERAVRVLSGDVRELERDLEARMGEASKERAFERAAELRDRLAALRRATGGQAVATRDRSHREALALARTADRVVLQRLVWREGRLAASRAHAFVSQLPDDELLHGALTQLYGPGRGEAPKELLLPLEPAGADLLAKALPETRLVVPKAGERARMLEMAVANAAAALARERGGDEAARAALEELSGIVGLDAAPEVIDGYDVSNTQGAGVVASRVRFRSGRPERDGYRRFKVRQVEGQDDFAAMREVVLRGLKRGVEASDLPDLVLIDGGAGQLASALEAREEAGAFGVALVSIAKAKGEKDERLYLPGRADPLPLGKHSPARHLLERIRDEAHRFAITFHRKERGRIRSRLDSIPGVGPARRKALLRRFGSVQGVERAAREQIAAVPGIGAALAGRILDGLRRDG